MRTIRSNREMDDLFREGTRVSHPVVNALVGRTPTGGGSDGRVAFVAGKRLGHAVQRNRSKRVLREAVRRSGGPWPGYDVVLIARPRTAEASPESIDDALRRVERIVQAQL